MLHPNEWQELPESVVDLFLEYQTFLLKDAARRIKTAGTMTNSAEWQLIRLQELGLSADTIQAELRKAVGLSRDAVERLYYEAGERSDRFDSEIMARAGLAPVPFEENAYLQNLLDAAKRQTNGELDNITQSMGFMLPDGSFEPVQRAYARALDFTQIQLAGGGVDYNTAIKGAVDLLAASGLWVVDYASGRHNRIDVAVRRAVMTGMGQVTGQISLHNAELGGTNLVEVTAHAGARDTGDGPTNHKQWQGKVYSLVGSTPEYPNLAIVTGYGTVSGLKGANCRHDFFPFFEGLSQPAYTAEGLQDIDPSAFAYEGKEYTAYEATQQQRKMETAMRQTERKTVAYEAAGLKDDYTAQAVRLARQRDVYAQFSHAAGLATQGQRTRAVGFGRSQARRATAAAKRAT